MDRNSKQFQQLRAKWYAKLKSKGFNDIEQADGNLKEWSSSRLIKRSAKAQATQIKWRESAEEYYRYAGFFLNEYEFKTKFEKIIWTMHCEGDSTETISKKLNAFSKTRIDKLLSGYNRQKRIDKDKRNKVKRDKPSNPKKITRIHHFLVYGIIAKHVELMKQKYIYGTSN